jgi:hypothetical protein
MVTKRKIILVSFIAALILLGSLSGLFLYYYFHPAAIKPLMEKSISRYTGTSFTIEKLSYSLRPFRIQAQGISATPADSLEGFHLEISVLKADIGLEGPLRHRILRVKNLMITGFSLRFSGDMRLPLPPSKERGPSLLNRVLKWMLGTFFFRDISFQSAELAGGTIAAQLKDQMIQVSEINAKLNPDLLIEVSCKAQIQWPVQKMTLTTPHLLITTAHAISLVEPKIEGLLTAQRMMLQSPDVNVSNMEVKAKFIYDHDHKNVSFKPMEFSGEGVTLTRVYERAPVPLNLRLKAEGAIDLRKRDLNATLLNLTAGDALQLQGKLAVGFGPQSSVGLELFESYLLPQKLLPFLPEGTRRRLAPLNVSGSLSVNGGIKGLRKQNTWSWHTKLQVGLIKNRYSYITEQIKLNGRATGTIQVEGKFPDIRLAVTMKAHETVLASKVVQLRPFNASLDLSGGHPVYKIRDLKAQIPKAKVVVGKKEVLIGDIEAHIREGTFDVEKRSLVLPEIRLDSSLLQNLLLSLRAHGQKVNIELKGERSNLFNSARILNLLPAGWQFSGVDSIRVVASQDKKGEWLFSSKLDLKELGFQNQDSSWMGEKISIGAVTKGRIYTQRASITATTSLRLHGGEILCDRFYSDLNRNTFFSLCEGTYDISRKSLQLSNLRLGLKGIVTLEMEGALVNRVHDRSARLSLNIPEIPLKPAFDYFVREPFQAEKPFLSALDTKGTFSADLTLTGSKADWAVEGNCRWHDGELSLGKTAISFQGIDLDLPVWYQTQQRNNNKGPVNGALSIQSMVLPLLPEQPLALALDAGPNLLSLTIPTIIKIPGGEVEVGPAVCRDLFSPRRSIETSLTVKITQIDPVISKIWSHPLKGGIRGKLDPVYFEGGEVKSYGDLRADVFGGEIVFSDLSASGLFSSAPVFKLSALWDDLSLGELTTATSFGKVEGVLKGYVKDLEIAFGQAQRFDLLLETVRRKGVPQKISVRAVDNIAFIGGGQSPFVGFAGSLASLFRNFPYEQIGIRALLGNDVFRINGTIREGGTEYLVKRGGLSGVNVVNQNPDNRISFKDMVKRIKRVTARSGGPVIK